MAVNPDTINISEGSPALMEALADAQANYDGGNFAKAAGTLKPFVSDRGLATDPALTKARYLRIESLRQAKEISDAIAEIPPLLKAAPLNAAAHLLAASCWQQAGQRDTAEAHFVETLLIDKSNRHAMRGLAQIYNQTNRRQQAADLLTGYFSQQPPTGADDAPVLIALGNAQRALGDQKAAAATFIQAAKLAPNSAAAQNALSIALLETGDTAGALAAGHRAVALAPDFMEAKTSLANALKADGNWQEAIALFTTVARSVTDRPHPAMQLANIYADSGRKEDAETWHRRALSIDPVFIPSLVNLANLLKDRGAHDEAITLYRKAIAKAPDFAPTYNNLAVLLKDQGRSTEALAVQQKAVALQPDFIEGASNLLLSLHYGDDVAPDAIWAAHKAFGKRFTAKRGAAAARHSNDTDPERCLRIGYISPDFRRHSVAFFIDPILAAHDRTAFSVYCYASHGKDDHITEQLKEKADHWRNIGGLGDDQAAARIREDKIDVLIDLAGHTARNRLMTMARRPAPVQMTYLGYPDTTGMAEIGWRITDPIADPPGMTEHWHSETLAHLPTGFLCFQPLPDTPEPAEKPPSLAEGPGHGRVTFGCFNNMAKLNPSLIQRWASVLKAVPDSRMIIKATPLGDPGPRAYLTQLFQDADIAADRLELVGRLPDIHAHLAYYRHVDIALDSGPYNGTTITCEALYMGVPVISLAGPNHVSRVGASLLTTVGAPELIAETEADFVEKAKTLAADHDRLISYRQSLRGMMEASDLMNPAAVTHALEQACRHAWRCWCARDRAATSGRSAAEKEAS